MYSQVEVVIMIVSETLNKIWRTVFEESGLDEGYYHRRFPSEANWIVHVGIHRPTNSRIVILESDARLVAKFRLKDETRGYIIEVCPSEMGRRDRVFIRIQEKNASCSSIFTALCSDVVTRWVEHVGVEESLKSIIQGLNRWKKFFLRWPQNGLSREEYIGLYGEISFIEAGIKAKHLRVPIVASWSAPLGSNQDFLFGSIAVEIKSTTSNEMDKVRITNIRQLDGTGLAMLFLARYAFDFREGVGRTLPQLVESLKSSLAAISIDLVSPFVERLFDAGFVEGVVNDFDGWGFTQRQFDVFHVTDGFPRLLESNLERGVSDVSYNLNLAAAQQFLISETEMWLCIK